MRVDFYHLTATPLEQALPAIAEKVVAGGDRLLIVAEEERLAALDALLWTWRKDSFLPHGLASAPGPARQPVLLSAAMEAANGADHVALADGRWRAEAAAFARAFYFFDAAHLDEARGAWRSLGQAEGVARHYWRQNEGGRWEEGP